MNLVYRTSLATKELRPHTKERHTRSILIKLQCKYEFSLQDKPGYNRMKAPHSRGGVRKTHNARTNLVYRTSLATIELRLHTAGGGGGGCRKNHN